MHKQFNTLSPYIIPCISLYVYRPLPITQPIYLTKFGIQTADLQVQAANLLPIINYPMHFCQTVKYCLNNSSLLPCHGKTHQSNNWTGGRFKDVYEFLNLRAHKISMLYTICIFQCIGKIFCVEFQRVPLKFHTKYLTHTLKDMDFIHRWKFKSS